MKKTKLRTLLLALALIALLGSCVAPSKDAPPIIDYPLLYSELVFASAEVHSLPPELVFAVIKAESNFVSAAVSSDGAIGLMQMMPTTFAEMCKRRKETHTAEDLFNPSINIDYCCYYLKYLIDYFGGDALLAVAAYNGGMGNVNKWKVDPNCQTDGVFDPEKIPFAETRGYVRKVLAVAEIYKGKIEEI